MSQRVGKNQQVLSIEDRRAFIDKITLQVMQGELTPGAALKILRQQVLGLKQDSFSKMVGVSRRVISDVENNSGNYSLDKLNKLFSPFGMHFGLQPKTYHRMQQLISNEQNSN